MTVQGPRDDSRLSIAFLPATPRQRKIALAFMVGLGCATGIIAWIGLVPLPRSDRFIPAVQGVIAAVEFITAVLLFAQCSTERSRALLLLAAGYLFTALIVVGHTLTFPGAFAPTGLFGAGPQTAAWLYVVWHSAVPAAACGYVLLKHEPPLLAGVAHTANVAIWRTVLLVFAAAAAVAWAAILAADSLPTLVVSETSFASMASVVTAFPLVLSVLAFALIWRWRTSVLDEWLLVALAANAAEMAVVVFIGASRYTLPFYAARPLGVVAACAVLVALLSEMTGLQARLSRAVGALQRERASKLMNLDVVVSSIAHEIKQPLTVITTCSTVIDNLLRKPKIDVDEVRLNLRDVTGATLRVAETIDGLRGLFRNPKEAQQPIDVNSLCLEALKTLESEVSSHKIAVTTELAKALPPVVGHKAQLREVLVNIVQNAIDALATLADRPRSVRIRTGYAPRNRISITIEDSGLGIEPDRLPSLFTAFITTKESGMGLGLGLCQMIVDRHNGQLSVTSDVGKGTRFEVTLPFDPTAVPAEPPGASSVKAEA
jgi:signal transduction histidine kinase